MQHGTLRRVAEGAKDAADITDSLRAIANACELFQVLLCSSVVIMPITLCNL